MHPSIAKRTIYLTVTPEEVAQEAATPKPRGYGPIELQFAYHVPRATTTRTVAIVDAFDDPAAEADLNTYRRGFRLPACTSDSGCFKKVDQNAGAHFPVSSAEWRPEISLDVDMVSAICPTCHILLVEANSASDGDMAKAASTAAQLGAYVVSNSYGDLQSKATDPAYDESKAIMVAAAGDYGYEAGPQEPASYMNVVAVGGTTLTYDSKKGWAESGWKGSGGGCSRMGRKPSWESDPSCQHRMANDVSAIANPDFGVAVFDSSNGGWVEYGGTSAATPIISALFAIAGDATATNGAMRIWKDAGAHMNPMIHMGTANDSNGNCSPPDPAYFCSVVSGYNGVTGWGSPNGITAL